MIVAALSGIVKGKNENLWSYIYQHTQVVVEVEGAGESVKCCIFKNRLLRDHPFIVKLGRKGA